nr:MAG TPA: hypothetical protein [Caudoviricetes sp.]
MAAWGHTVNKVRTGKRKAPFGAEGGGGFLERPMP